jgi:hypothetical protein
MNVWACMNEISLLGMIYALINTFIRLFEQGER